MPLSTALPSSRALSLEKNTEFCVQEKYTVLEQIGKGAFGVVYRAKDNILNRSVALKTVEQDYRYKNRELSILCFLKEQPHENIIPLLDSFTSTHGNSTFLNLIFPLLPSTLADLIKASNIYLTKESIKIYTKQMFLALKHLHQYQICHRDIKPTNLLCDPDLQSLKLADFGSAKFLKSSESNISYICSRFYRAPELIFGVTQYSTKIDIWGAGCVFAEMFTTVPLFAGKSSTDMLREMIIFLGPPSKEDCKELKISHKKIRSGLKKSADLKEVIKDEKVVEVLQHIFVFSPLKRWSARDVLECEYLK